MPKSTGKQPRGRTEIGKKGLGKSASRRHTDNEQRTQTSRSVGPGAGVHRGDRRDTHPTYTGNVKHRARGNTPRPNVATRKD